MGTVVTMNEDSFFIAIQYPLRLLGCRRIRRASQAFPESGASELAFMPDPGRGLDRVRRDNLGVRGAELYSQRFELGKGFFAHIGHHNFLYCNSSSPYNHFYSGAQGEIGEGKEM